MTYYAHFRGEHGFRVYKIVVDSDEEAKHIALAYDKGNTRSGDRLVIYALAYDKENTQSEERLVIDEIVNEVVA